MILFEVSRNTGSRKKCYNFFFFYLLGSQFAISILLKEFSPEGGNLMANVYSAIQVGLPSHKSFERLTLQQESGLEGGKIRDQASLAV